MNWKDLFKIMYHPGSIRPYIVHWRDTHVPVDDREWMYEV